MASSIMILVPYQIDPLDDTYLYDEPRTMDISPRIWA